MFSNISRYTLFGMSVYLILAMISAGFAGFLFGVNTGNIAGALPFIQQELKTSILQNECLVASTILCAAFSALISLRMSGKYGLRKVLLFTGFCFVLGPLISGASNSFYVLLLGRMVLGFAVGISSYAAPLYISEIAPAQHRGFCVLLNGFAITSGEAVAFYINYYYSTSGEWRAMLEWSIFPAIIFLIGMSLIPSSPRWYIARDKLSEALHILKTFHRENTAIILLNEMKTLQNYTSVSLRTLLSQKNCRIPLIIGVGLGVFQQFFGINTVMYYGPFIFEKAGFSLTSSAIWVTFIMGLFNILTTILTACLVDIIGRRKLLLLGSFIACISLLSIAYLFLGDINTLTSFYIVFLMMIYIIGYCMSVGSLFWLMISEIFPLPMKGQGASIATSIQWFSNFIVSLTFLSMLNTWGVSATFLFFSMICCGAIFFVYSLIPETKKLSLEQISIGIGS